MSLKSILFSLLTVIYLIMANTVSASIIVPMSFVDAKNHGASIGTIKLDNTIYGLLLTPYLHDLPAGFHGFVVGTSPSCENYARASGGHWDPAHTQQHQGPYQGNGHLGDLPVLLVNMHGHATLPILAPRLTTSLVAGHSLVVLAGTDNYSETPLAQENSNIKIACGVIGYH